MDTEAVALLRADVIALRGEVATMRQDIGSLEAKSDSIEAWRTRYLTQEDQILNKLFTKVDDLAAALGEMRADLYRIRGERDAERRISVMVISLLSAACGGLATSMFHG